MILTRQAHQRFAFVLRLSCALLTIACCPKVQAKVALPAIFGDHMVLQRGMEVPIWGWADPGERVRVAIDHQQHETTADANGRWRASPAAPAGRCSTDADHPRPGPCCHPARSFGG